LLGNRLQFCESLFLLSLCCSCNIHLEKKKEERRRKKEERRRKKEEKRRKKTDKQKRLERKKTGNLSGIVFNFVKVCFSYPSAVPVTFI
jgi:hypothetical protein